MLHLMRMREVKTMDKSKNSLKKDIYMLFWVTLSATIQAISLTSFSMPQKLYPSGFSGISRIICDLSLDFLNINLPFGVVYVLLNIVPTIVVFNSIGKRFTIFSIVQYLLVSIFSGIFPPIINVSDKILLSVFGGIINGIGVGIALSHNTSSGGVDFVAIYVSNKFHRSIWNYVMYGNIFILTIAGLIYGWEKALYSIILQFCSTQMVQKMHKRYTMKTMTIITSKADEVVTNVLKNTRHGITEIKAEGAFLHQDKTMLYTVVNSFQTKDVIHSVLEVDSKAFINIQDTERVIGNYYQKPLD